jgi:hypothetical protein
MAGISELLQVIRPASELGRTVSSSPQYMFSYGRYALVTVVTYLMTTFVYTYQAVCFTLIYFEVRKQPELKRPM